MATVRCPHCNTEQQIHHGSTVIRCIRCSMVMYVGPQPELAVRHPLPRRPPKRAVICGISYGGDRRDRPVPLDGCINDAEFMKRLLVNQYGFSDQNSIWTLTDQIDSYSIPTKDNIIKALKWLVDGSLPGDSLVFYFSGHGYQQEDDDGDEIDGLDEMLLPSDYDRTNRRAITDDELNELIVRPLPAGVKLHAIIDSCHSGTVLDLPYLCHTESLNPRWISNDSGNGLWKGTQGGQVICFSACDDHELAREKKHHGSTSTNGAMTFSLIQAITQGKAYTYWSLFKAIRSSIEDGDDEERTTPLVRDRGVSKQVPQLTSTYIFDVNTPFSL